MSDNSVSQYLTEALLIVLDETFENVKGIYLDKGTSLFETLATISAEEASIPVSASCASVAAHVEHMRFHIDTLMRLLQGEQPEVDWSEIWRTVREVNSEEWQASQQNLRRTYENLKTFVADIDTWNNSREIAGALGLIAHNAYHLGEIRQALCTLKNKD